MKKYICYTLILLAMAACKKEKEPAPPSTNNPAPATGAIKIQFSHVVGADALVLAGPQYINQNGDTFTVTKFNYYVSNIRLIKTDNSVYAEPESYHLVKSSDPASLVFTIAGVPRGEYSSVSFVLGVDSARNVSGSQTGALDPAHGMFWSWSTGYIMGMLEGTSPQAPGTGALTYHISGFSGANNVLKTINLSLPLNAQVGAATPVVHVKTDIAEWFRSPNLTKFGITYLIHSPGAAARSMADNYADMFTVEQVVN